MFPVPAQLLSRFPQSPPRYLLSRVLNTLFRNAIIDGELDFLDGRRLQVDVSDISITFDVTLQGDRLKLSLPTDGWDLRISGGTYDFMLLASRREDADTLFFQRRLKTEGDTELGLYLKNFLDSQDLSDLPYSGFFESALKHAINIHDKLLLVRHGLQH
ncbi:MAG: SCP2 sterol-binding domain-containing protein [Chromatiales bacterium]|jgi:predicted lipid carrier protein YhbT